MSDKKHLRHYKCPKFIKAILLCVFCYFCIISSLSKYFQHNILLFDIFKVLPNNLLRTFLTFFIYSLVSTPGYGALGAFCRISFNCRIQRLKMGRTHQNHSFSESFRMRLNVPRIYLQTKKGIRAFYGSKNAKKVNIRPFYYIAPYPAKFCWAKFSSLRTNVHHFRPTMFRPTR